MVTVMSWNFADGHIKSFKICAFCKINCWFSVLLIYASWLNWSQAFSQIQYVSGEYLKWLYFLTKHVETKENCYSVSIFINLCLSQRDEVSYCNPFHRWKMDSFWNYIFTAPTLNVHIKSGVENNKVSEASFIIHTSFKTNFTVSGTSINMNSN